jgi:predicted nucleotidyltransferase
MLPSDRLHKHRAEVLGIMKRYPMFANLRVIGSVARGEDTEASDIDFLVDALPDATLCDLGGLIEDFEELLGISVDVITTGVHINGYMKTTIERDAIAYE